MPLLEQVRKVLLKFLKKSSGLTEILQLKHLKFLTLLAGLRHLAHRNFHGFRKEWEGLKALQEAGETQAGASSQPCPPEPRLGTVCFWRPRGPFGCPGQVGAPWLTGAVPPG